MTKINSSASAWPRLPINHTPQEQNAPASIWVSCSGTNLANYQIKPRAIWFNDLTTYRCISSINHPNISNIALTAYITPPVRGFESAIFDMILLSDGSQLPSLTSAYFVW